MKNNRILNIILVWALAIFSFAGIKANNVLAASNTMTVSPPYQKVLLEPGETYSNYLTVFNASGSTRDLKFSVEIGSFSQHKNESSDSKDDYDSMDHISVSSYNQIMDWITLEKKNGVLAPGETTEIPYTINVPKNAPAGGQYATILVIDETTSGGSNGQNIVIDQKFQFASIIYAEVAGETKEIGKIIDNSVPAFLLNGPLQATSMVKNDGNVHTDAEYTLQVWPLIGGEEICTNEEEPETSLILPESERYHAQTCDLPQIGIFRAKQVVKIFDETSTVERVIIMCPLWLLFVIILGIILIIIWILTKLRKTK